MVDAVKYDPETGYLIWKNRPQDFYSNPHSAAKFNGRFAGNVAGNIIRPRGNIAYVELSLTKHGKRERLYAHRVIWEMHNGPIPEGMDIDHIDGNGLNNRLANLRVATRSQNLRNRGAQVNNKIGLKGVHLTKSGRYGAKIGNKWIGAFDTPEMAHYAYVNAARKEHSEFAHP